MLVRNQFAEGGCFHVAHHKTLCFKRLRKVGAGADLPHGGSDFFAQCLGQSSRGRYADKVFGHQLRQPQLGHTGHGGSLRNTAWLPRPLRILDKAAMRRNAAEVIARLQVRLPHPDAPVAMMSGGQRQAIAVARATVFARNIVLLDEPTAALGLREARKVLDLIARLRDAGNAVILITHNMEHVTELADRAVVLRQGRKVGELKPEASTRQELVAMIVGAEG